MQTGPDASCGSVRCSPSALVQRRCDVAGLSHSLPVPARPDRDGVLLASVLLQWPPASVSAMGSGALARRPELAQGPPRRHRPKPICSRPRRREAREFVRVLRGAHARPIRGTRELVGASFAIASSSPQRVPAGTDGRRMWMSAAACRHHGSCSSAQLSARRRSSTQC
ncbi:hypothetical protein BD413DRAFT_237404 [Trametes elegans]|nr:hypothetical protein BD413DRAFT_237404 [Trametes elegans]